MQFHNPKIEPPDPSIQEIILWGLLFIVCGWLMLLGAGKFVQMISSHLTLFK